MNNQIEESKWWPVFGRKYTQEENSFWEKNNTKANLE